jgi:hypothetical protein
MSDEIKPTSSVTEGEKIEFYKAFLADKPFTATEKLFNDNFTIVFRSLDVKQAGDVFETLRKDQINNIVNSDAKYMMMLTNYRLGQSIVSINGEPYLPEVNELSGSEEENYIKLKAKPFDSWPVFKLSAVADAFKAFENKIIELTKEVQTPDFWAAVQ